MLKIGVEFGLKICYYKGLNPFNNSTRTALYLIILENRFMMYECTFRRLIVVCRVLFLIMVMITGER